MAYFDNLLWVFQLQPYQNIQIGLVYTILMDEELHKCIPAVHRMINFLWPVSYPLAPVLSHGYGTVGFDHPVWVYLTCALRAFMEVSIKERHCFNVLSHNTLFIPLIILSALL